MEFIGNINEVSFSENKKPLFDAIVKGDIISEIICMDGSSNANNRAKDFTIKDFTPTEYWQGVGYSKEKSFDQVFGLSENKEARFYMSWVLSFKL